LDGISRSAFPPGGCRHGNVQKRRHGADHYGKKEFESHVMLKLHLTGLLEEK
jgi:hypothetical protein